MIGRIKHEPSSRGQKKWHRSTKREPYLFLAPTNILLLAFLGYPLVNSVLLAFKNYKLTTPGDIHFNGLDNYHNIFFDPNMGLIIKNSIIWVTSSVTLQFFLGLILALALYKPFRGRNIYQAIVFLPWAFSSFIVGLTFKWMFNGEYGPVNDLLLKTGLVSSKIGFLSTPGLALISVIIAMVWVGIPFFAIMLLAALQSIPADVYEAADIDGASSFVKFRRITLPYIRSTIIMTLLLRTIWVFGAVDLIYVMTYGGPANSSNTLASYMFMKAYSTLDFGQAAAIGVFFMVILIVYSILFIKVTRFNKAGDF